MVAMVRLMQLSFRFPNRRLSGDSNEDKRSEEWLRRRESDTKLVSVEEIVR